MKSFLRRTLLTGFESMTLLATPVRAQDKTLKIVFPFSAGGASDAVTRLLAEQLQRILGRSVIVENKVGAGGRINALAIKDSPPDGSTLLFAAAAQMTLQPHLFPDLGTTLSSISRRSRRSSNSTRYWSSADKSKPIQSRNSSPG